MVGASGRARGLRVLLLNYEYPPVGGGAGNATRHVAQELRAIGVEADVLTSRHADEADGALDGEVPVWRVASWRKSVHDCGLRGAYTFAALATARRHALHRRQDYALEHFFFALPTGALALLPPHRPYVVSLRGSDVPGYDPFNTKLERLHQITLPVTRRILTRASAVVALSDSLRNQAAVTVPGLPIGVIPNAIDTEHFRPVAVREAPGGRPLRVITVSRLLERKGIHHLLEAIARPTPLDVELRIVGTGSYERELHELCRKLKLTNRVRFDGFVPRTLLPEAYRWADLFALPSQCEAFGLVFAEAMASGLAIVGTRVGGIPSVVREGVDGFLVDPADPAAVRAALRRYVAEPALTRSMGDAGRAKAVAVMGWGSVARSYLRIYEEVLSRDAAVTSGR